MENCAARSSQACNTAGQASSQEPHPDDVLLAQQRVMAYLKALGIPEPDASAYAAAALQQSRQTTNLHPVVSAMRALHALLITQQIDSPWGSLDSLRGTIVAPALNRSSMLPIELDRTPWRTFFRKHILRKKT